MKNFKLRIVANSILIAPLVLSLAFIVFTSFVANKVTGDFLKQLGLSKNGADEKITNSIIGGSLDLEGARTAKNILLGNRKAVVLDLLEYTKKHVSGPAFIKEYNSIKANYKPKENIAQTAEEMRLANVAAAKKGIADMEEIVRKSDATYKPMFQKSLDEAKKNLLTLGDPNNKMYVNYAKNYERLVKDFKTMYERDLAEWEKKYPGNQLLYVKMRLLEFMEATKDIDFNAELKNKNGLKVFVNPEYERKDSRWKMAFRAGKEVVEPAREFVEKWIAEIQ